MKNVVIASVKTSVDNMKNRLSSDCNVIGWIDFDKECEDDDSVDSRINKISIKELLQEDNIILAENKTYVDELNKAGVPRNRVINYQLYVDTTLENPLKGFSPQHTGLLMGMSHSQCAIDEQKLPYFKYFKLSSPSMDMFCHYGFLKKIIKDYPCSINNIQQIIIELPYYIFNYDLSQFGDFVYTKLLYFKLIGDFHHITDPKINEEFSLYTNIIDKPKPFVRSHAKLKDFLSAIGVTRIRTIYRSITNRDNVWVKYYKDTVKENISLWENFLSLVRDNFPNAKLLVLVTPMNSLFRVTHKEEINKWRTIFYENMKGLDVLDNFELYNNPFLYGDHCHLNSKGGMKYTNYLKNQLQ